MSKQTKIPLIAGNPCFIKLDGDFTEEGCEAKYYDMGKSKFGIKTYSNLELAIASYSRQQKAAEHNLAPKVRRFLLVKNGKRICYGYETEKAEQADSGNNFKIYKKQCKSLCKRLRSLGMGGDFGDVNCGVINGILVAVDFGSHCEAKW